MQNVEKQKTFNIAEWRTLSSRVENQPPAKRGQTRKAHQSLAENHNKKKCTPTSRDAEVDSSEFTRERCLELERIYWKTLTYNSPLYGADMPGSLFDKSTQSWNVAKLDDMLNTLSVKIPGVNSAYLYCGMWKSTFAWHLEDMDLYSINYIHFGAPKLWYSISQEDKDKFFQLMCDIWPEEFKNCREFLRHKTFHVSPSLLRSHGIQVNRLIHYEHEFVLTFPYGYHAGFNFGYNCAESVNFATKDWLPLGMLAQQCRCISDSVGIDVVKLFQDQKEGAHSGSLIPLAEEQPKSILNTVPKRKRNPSNKSLVCSESAQSETLICVLCPARHELPLIRSKDDRAVHRLCALYIPETYSEIGPSGEEFVCGLENIPKARWLLKCSYCGLARGACVQCSCVGCTRSFHASCVQSAGTALITENSNHGPKLKFLCRSHRTRGISQQTKRQNLKKAYSLLPGDMIQFQFYTGRLFSGVVQKNNLSEQSALIAILPSLETVIEVFWDKISIPGLTVNESPKRAKLSHELTAPASSEGDGDGFERTVWNKKHYQVPIPPCDLTSQLLYYKPQVSSDAVAFYDRY